MQRSFASIQVWLCAPALIMAAAEFTLHAEESPMTYIALKDREIGSLALNPSGDVLVGTDKGVWRVSQDGKTVDALPTDGLPPPADKCSTFQMICSRRGDIFTIPGKGKEGIYRLRAGAGRWESVGKKTIFIGVQKEVAQTLAILPDDALLVTMANPSIYRGETVSGRVYRSTDTGDNWTDVTPLNIAGAYISSLVSGPGHEVWGLGGPGISNTFDPTRWVLFADDWRAARPDWKIRPIQQSQKPGAILGEPKITGVAVDLKGTAYALVTSGNGCPAGIYRSTDKGATWKRVNDSQEINVVQTTPDAHAYVGSYGGLLRTTDGGATWNSYAGLGKTFVTSILIDRDGFLWAGTGSHGQLFPVPGLFRSRVAVGTGVKSDPGPVEAPFPPSENTPSTLPPISPPAAEPKRPSASVIFDNGNPGSVQNSPTMETTFELEHATLITKITNYHWNKGHGSPVGTISLRTKDGKVYGPWKAVGGEGQGKVTNAYWICTPDFRLEAGTYIVVDSEPTTWSQNAESDHKGITKIEGIPSILRSK